MSFLWMSTQSKKWCANSDKQVRIFWYMRRAKINSFFSIETSCTVELSFLRVIYIIRVMTSFIKILIASLRNFVVKIDSVMSLVVWRPFITNMGILHFQCFLRTRLQLRVNGYKQKLTELKNVTWRLFQYLGECRLYAFYATR